MTIRIVSGPVTQLARDDKYQNRTPQLFKMQDPEKQTLFGGEYRVQIIALIKVFHEL